jgi:hypothetical protein
MIIIGLLLLIAALVFGIELVFANHHLYAHSPVVFGQSLGIHNEAALFIVGAITGAVILLGLSLIASGLRLHGAAAARRIRASKDAAATRDERDALAADNARLKAELERESVADQSPVAVVVPPVVVPPAGVPAEVEVPVVRDDSATGRPVYH